MVFSSIIFLFLFLPGTLLIYYLVNKEYRNSWLLLASLVFFAWGGVSYTALLILSILANYIFGYKIQETLDTPAARRWLLVGVSSNIALLVVFKYANFFLQSINDVGRLFSLPGLAEANILLPVGISFYTFHSLSYLIDIYRKKVTAQRNIFDLSLYITMFSQLIAGPIIRYSDIWQQLRTRTHTREKFASGVERFLIGLAKKVLLANFFAIIADSLFDMDPSELVAINAWLGIICYTFQIYCDFSGYSDMAIGLGRMFGFEFLENFNFPYIARSVKDFWRRWHISLSTFFRDYVYIPLGGSRVSMRRTYLNLLLVFFLTGFWHGASWSFIVWGLFHGFFMVLERIGFEKILERSGRVVSTSYTLLVVVFGWVLFRAETIGFAWNYWKAMFDFHVNAEQLAIFKGYFDLEFCIVLVVTIAGNLGLFQRINNWFSEKTDSGKKVGTAYVYTYHISSAVFYGAILVLCSMYLMSGTYNPFIYYRF